MKIKVFTFLGVLLLLFPNSVIGQISVYVGSRQSAETVVSEIPVVVAEPSINGFSTVEFSKQFPRTDIKTENINVNFPDLSGAIDTIGILWYLKPENYSQKGEINIVLIKINPDSSKTFFVDNNNDRTFSDNEESFTFNPETEKRILDIKILGSYYKYTILNPDFLPPARSASMTKDYYKAWHLTNKRLSISADFSFVTGAGYTSLNFEPLSGSVDRYNYFATISGSIRPTFGLDFSFLNFHISFSGSFERLQYDETARFGYIENVSKPQRDYNSDPWMETKLHAGVTAEYDFGLFRSLWISPFGTYARYKNTDNKVFDIRLPNSGSEYKDMHSTEYGLKLKLPTNYRSLIYVKASYIKSWFDATEFLPAYSPGSYSLDYHQTYFGVGFQYRFL